MKALKYLFTLNLVFCFFNCFARQDTSLIAKNSSATHQTPIIDSSKQRDAIDILQKILHINTSADQRKVAKKLLFAAVPAAGYSLSTGFGVAITSNLAFYTSGSHQENLSVITAEGYFDTKAQKVFISRGEVWADKNNYKLVTDIRIEKFPEDTYGLGTFTTNTTQDPLVYNYLRTYATLLKKITPIFMAA